MQIKHTLDRVLANNLLNFGFDPIDLRMQILIRLPPIPIEIKPPQIAPKIAIDNPINIDHGKYLKRIILQQLLHMFLFVLCQHVQELLHHE